VLNLNIGIPINICAKLNICSLNALTSPIPKPLYENQTESMLRKTIISLLTYFIYVSAFGQVDVTSYKNTADKFLESKFNKKFYGKWKFKSFYSTTPEEGYWHFNTDQLKSNTIDSFVSITFQYSFFAKRLNKQLDFEVTIKKDSSIDNTVNLSCYIPDCILNDTTCNLLTKDQAIVIAKKSKIRYSVDFDIDFAKPINKKEYYWHIIGFNHKVDRTPNKRTSYRFSGSQQRIINARTGEVVSYENYTKDD
jgi:hypothetical protein